MNTLQQNWLDLPILLSWHLLLSLFAIATAAVLAFGLTLAADGNPRLKTFSLTISSIVQTIPALALLALMVPLLGGAIGFLPAYLALTAYAVLPMLQNSITGISETDPRLVDAARGLGMSEKQVLFKVRFPLAFPVILAGLRTATVWTVGMTTLATAVGASGLGVYIFTGLQTRNHTTTLFGCFFAAALSVVLDQILRMAEHAVRSRRRKLAGFAFAILAVLLVSAAAGIFWPASDELARERYEPVAIQETDTDEAGLPLSGQQFTTGSKSYVESYILGEMLALHLEAAGATIDNRSSMGSTILFDALRQNKVDTYVDFSGTIWATLMKREDPATRLQTRIEAASYLLREHGVTVVGPLGFENNYALSMTSEKASQLGIRSISDLAGQRLTIGGDPEIFGRPEWGRLRELYGLELLSTRAMQAIYMFDAVRNDQVDVIIAYSTDGRLADSNLLILEDSLRGFPPYDALILVSPSASENLALIRVLSELVNRISDDDMRRANRLVEVDGLPPRAAAERLLEFIR